MKVYKAYEKNEVKFGSASMCVEGGQCEQKGVKKGRVSGD